MACYIVFQAPALEGAQTRFQLCMFVLILLKAPALTVGFSLPQVRFFLHAPLQLVSVFFAAASTSDMCSALYSSIPGVGCIGVISALQLSLGLLLPSLVVHCLDSKGTPTYMPHVQAKRWLPHP